MSKITPIHVATKAFRATIDGETFDVAEGERVIATHTLISRYPQNFRERGLQEELAIRSACIAAHREAASRPASSTPVSRAGRAEAEATRFWSSTVDLLERTAPDRASAEERREQAFYTSALDQIEDSDAARMRAERIELNELWVGRLEE